MTGQIRSITGSKTFTCTHINIPHTKHNQPQAQIDTITKMYFPNVEKSKQETYVLLVIESMILVSDYLVFKGRKIVVLNLLT